MAGVKLTWKGERVTRNISERLEKGIIAAANHFAFQLRASLLEHQGSIENKIHSSPGEIPYYITKKLAGSVRVVNKKRNLSRISIDIKSNRDYDNFLEFGTYKMAPRPHWMVVFNREEKKLIQIIKQSFLMQTPIGPMYMDGIEGVGVERI